MTGFETTHGRSDTRWSKPQFLGRRRDRSTRDEGDWSGGAERRSPPSAPTLKVFLRELAARNVLGYIVHSSSSPSTIATTGSRHPGEAQAPRSDAGATTVYLVMA